MKVRRLGKSPIHVSEICMGTMTFGNQADEAMAHRVLDQSLDAGINFFDTAEGYPVPPDIKYVGLTEEIVGRWMKTKNRDAIIMATKVSGSSHTWFKSPKRAGMTVLDRRNIMVAVEDSLRRLQTARAMKKRWTCLMNWSARARCAFLAVRMRPAGA
jgi:aryl-alcohol dehydrogenase-like predicted oxidoreductase